jgi:hypothetical protein
MPENFLLLPHVVPQNPCGHPARRGDTPIGPAGNVPARGANSVRSLRHSAKTCAVYRPLNRILAEARSCPATP